MFDEMRQAVREIMESDWIEQICQSELDQKSEREEPEVLDDLRDWEWNSNND